MTDLLSSRDGATSWAAFGAPDEAADIELLHRISTVLIGEQDRVELYGKIVDAAVTITGSQFGTMQLLLPQGDPSGHGGELQLLCSRGLPPEAVGFWQWVNPKAHSSCTQALKFRQRAIIPDFEAGGWTVSGKTGSARLRDGTGKIAKNRPFGWFVGWAQREGQSIVFARLRIGTAPPTTPMGPETRAIFLKELPKLPLARP